MEWFQYTYDLGTIECRIEIMGFIRAKDFQEAILKALKIEEEKSISIKNVRLMRNGA